MNWLDLPSRHLRLGKAKAIGCLHCCPGQGQGTLINWMGLFQFVLPEGRENLFFLAIMNHGSIIMDRLVHMHKV